MSDAGPPAWPSKALRAAQKSRVGGWITKVKENRRKSERFSCVVQQLLMKSNLPFPLAHRILKELHNQSLEMRLTPTDLEGSLPSGWARRLGFPCLHLTKLVQGISELPENSPICGSPLGQQLVCLAALPHYNAN